MRQKSYLACSILIFVLVSGGNALAQGNAPPLEYDDWIPIDSLYCLMVGCSYSSCASGCAACCNHGLFGSACCDAEGPGKCGCTTSTTIYSACFLDGSYCEGVTVTP